MIYIWSNFLIYEFPLQYQIPNFLFFKTSSSSNRDDEWRFLIFTNFKERTQTRSLSSTFMVNGGEELGYFKSNGTEEVWSARILMDKIDSLVKENDNKDV
jgi:hypothetical protein